MAISEKVRQALSPALYSFSDFLPSQGITAPSCASPEAIAELFRTFFSIPCPMCTCDAGSLLQRFQYQEVFLQPGLEKYKHVRGFWDVEDNKIVILLEAARPDPSKIKTLLHEMSEQLLLIGYSHYPQVPTFEEKKREEWANRFAAAVKMPPDTFLSAVEEVGIDLEKLSEMFGETLAGVSRHIKNLYMKDRLFYFARVFLENDPEHHCSDLLPCLNESNGLCVYITDAVKTAAVNAHRRRGGALPIHNVARKAQFRVMHPKLRLFSQEDNPKDAPPILISRLRAATGFGSSQLELDLLESQDLAMLIYPIAKKHRLSGFFVVAVHYKDLYLFDGLRASVCTNRQDAMDWVFSWEKEEYEKVPDDDLEEKLSGQPTLDLFDKDISRQRTRWQPGLVGLEAVKSE